MVVKLESSLVERRLTNETVEVPRKFTDAVDISSHEVHDLNL